MKLKLLLDRVSVTFGIEYYESDNERKNVMMCKTPFSFVSNDGNWLNYNCPEAYTMANIEVKKLLESLKKLILDEYASTEEVSFFNQTFRFILHPKHHLEDKELLPYYNDKVFPSYLEWRLYFLYDDFGENFLTVRLNETEIGYLKNFLSYVTGEIDKSNIVIQNMISNNILIE